ncbi:MAG: glucose-6-phosphate dehydrogenase assembly protein OpcA [Bryobacteraceae bacterium]
MTPVKPERILKDLAKLWKDLSKEDPEGVQRACAMTFVAVVDEAQDAASVTETLATLMHEHPSRLIVLRVGGGDELHLEARVFAQCWLPFGKRQQICCEQIEISSSPGSLPDVVSLVRSLIAPDLPVVVYCPSENLWWLKEFQQLLPLADKLILDSTSMPESQRVLTYLEAVPNGKLRKADLAWSRLSPWRESIAQIFEDPMRRRAVNELAEIEILYQFDDEPAAVYYLAGWFRRVLGAGVKLKIARGAGPSFCSIGRVALIGLTFRASVELVQGSAVQTTVNGVQQQVILYTPLSEYDALRQELSISGRDPVFEDVLGLAQSMKATI